MIFSSIFYTIGCFVIAAILTTVTTMLRPAHNRDDHKPYLTFLIFFVIVGGGPYAYIQYLTKTQGPGLDAAVHKAYAATDVQGPLKYFRVRWCTGTTANVYVMAEEKESWGLDHPILSFNFKKVDGNWVADSFKPIDWPKESKDGLTFPPMY